MYNAVYAHLLGGCSCAFFHFVLSGAVWAGFLAFAFIVFVVKFTTFKHLIGVR
jgi:hypothetical protein